MSANRVLTITLIIGGIAPVLSGILAMFFGDQYIYLMGSDIQGMFTDHTYPFLLSWVNLQGGDAFVAGISRVIVALIGAYSVKRVFAAVGIFHSLFEMWLLPTQALSWCHLTGQCRPLFVVEIWAFVALHVVLIVGFSYGLYQGRRERKRRSGASVQPGTDGHSMTGGHE
ncbi:hypothetical protein [Haloferax mediterranei]|uniref:hypothetical protein n=1 Tax=Haloferax mediterranei TaxID=2252 RepID=UPI001E44B21D|nr:hypothetical protein [Haloferax mediterranei]